MAKHSKPAHSVGALTTDVAIGIAVMTVFVFGVATALGIPPADLLDQALSLANAAMP